MVFSPSYPHFNRYRAITYREYIVNAYLPYKKSYFHSKILIFDQFMGKNLNLVRCPNMVIWIFAHNSFFVQSEYEFLRPLATSRAPIISVLGMLRLLGIIGPQIYRIWVNCSKPVSQKVTLGVDSEAWNE